MRREKSRERFATPVRFRNRFDGYLRMQRSGAADYGKHQFGVIGGEQFVEHCAVNFFFRAGECQVGEPRARDDDFFCGEVIDDLVAGCYDIDAKSA